MRALASSTILLLILLNQSVYILTATTSRTEQIKSRLLLTNDIHRANELSDSSSGSSRSSVAGQLSPIILLPGDGGSRLQAKLDRPEVSHLYCERKSNDWYDLWLNLSLLVPFAIDCWLENMKLSYNTTSRTTRNAPGVITRVNGFGRAESVEFVDPSRLYGTNYFDSLVKQLVELGYERDKNIMGAPYDFRRAPNELQDFFKDLRVLVERTYKANGDEKVVFVCHSMGCLNALYFLNHNSQSWKDKYMRSMIALSGPWGGSVKALKAFASGDNFGVVVIPALSIRKDVRTFPSLAYLLPSKELWPANKTLVKNREKKYTVEDYKEFFTDINYPNGYEMWLDVHNLTLPSSAPGVEVHCLHGHKVSTVEVLDYEVGEFPDAKPRVSYGDGDGTVNLISLQACISWADKQKQPLYYRNFSTVDHMTIMSDSKVLDYIGEALVKF